MNKKQKNKFLIVDGNTAVARMAYQFSEVSAIYPITPSTSMGELFDLWSSQGKKNLFGETVSVVEMQSEAGVSGTIHGSLVAGAMTTTFTASQGLLLMLPNMHKMAGELLPTVFHVASRSLAYQALSIFNDHSDVMSARNTGFALLGSANVQEAQDFAVISHLASLESSIPFLHFFDGFRNSSEIKKIIDIDEKILKSLLKKVEPFIKKFKKRALNPENPSIKVGAKNPNIYFQGRESVNKYYDNLVPIVEKYMKLFAQKTGRKYEPFEYFGSPRAKKVIIAMCSGLETIEETVEYLNKNNKTKVGVLKVRLYRPFSAKHFLSKLPKTVEKIAVLDKTKESGSLGEPLYLDVSSLLGQNEKYKNVKIIGGRYGLSSKEFTPGMVKGVFDYLDQKAKHDFVVGIKDDVTNKSISYEENLDLGFKNRTACKFWGYGSDGTVGSCKDSIKIIGENTDFYTQAYFSYDSYKSGGVTVSHLRFGKNPIKSEYLVHEADFIALHKKEYIGKYDILKGIKKNGIFLINSPWKSDELMSHLTEEMQKIIKNKNINVYTIDANKIASSVGLGHRINTVMQVAFFKLSNLLPEKKALELIKKSIEKKFITKGQKIIDINKKCVDKSISEIIKVNTSQKITKSVPEKDALPKNLCNQNCSSYSFAKDIIAPIFKRDGNNIPVSKILEHSIVPTGTTKLEKRGIANYIPKWIPEKCIQCGRCAISCPHSSIRIKQIEKKNLKNAPKTFQTIKSNTDKNKEFRVQVYPEDCMGTKICGNCINQCPTGALEIQTIEEARKSGENKNREFFDDLPDNILAGADKFTVKGSQMITPLFEFSGACAGCGETPYVKLATQLYGENMIIANATGCSSIWGGTYPTTPYTKNKEGRGPAWANSLFEDNAEYGYGFKIAIDANRRILKSKIKKLSKHKIGVALKKSLEKMLRSWNFEDKAKVAAIELREELKKSSQNIKGAEEKELLNKIIELEQFLIEKDVWIFGGDGWAYDIGFGGLDHVLASGKNLNVLVFDTEVYSNTGGQCSKATPRGAIAKFAASGKKLPKKNLGMIFMTYGNIFVGSVSLGANMQHTINVLKKAKEYKGPSIIIAYSPCIAHGIDMSNSIAEEKLAVDSGYWPLFYYDPEKIEKGEEPLVWSSNNKSKSFQDYLNNENRYKRLTREFPTEAKRLFKLAEEDSEFRNKTYQNFQNKK